MEKQRNRHTVIFLFGQMSKCTYDHMSIQSYARLCIFSIVETVEILPALGQNDAQPFPREIGRTHAFIDRDKADLPEHRRTGIDALMQLADRLGPEDEAFGDGRFDGCGLLRRPSLALGGLPVPLRCNRRLEGSLAIVSGTERFRHGVENGAAQFGIGRHDLSDVVTFQRRWTDPRVYSSRVPDIF